MADPTTTAVAPSCRAIRTSSGCVMWPSTSTGIVRSATMDWTSGHETVRMVSGLGGVAVEGGGDSIGSGAFGGESVFEGGDIGEDWAVELGVDAADQLGPGFGGR